MVFSPKSMTSTIRSQPLDSWTGTRLLRLPGGGFDSRGFDLPALGNAMSKKLRQKKRRIKSSAIALPATNRPRTRKRFMRATYDAAQISSATANDWAGVDNLAPNAADSPAVREILRKRGRHEMLNNPYMDGILQTLSGDVIGQSPRLRMTGDDKDLNTFIEQEFERWMRATRFPAKLRLAVETVAAQGEIFGWKFRNPKLATTVKLDLNMIEGDQVASPFTFISNNQRDVDGIEYDRWGNPETYLILRNHPGDNRFFAGMDLTAFDRVPASRILHYFKVRRPGQRRGLPRIMSSMSLFPQRRSWRQSVLTAARAAAQLGAIVLESEIGPDPNSYSDSEYQNEAIEPGSTFEVEHGMMTALPQGAKAHQMKAEQPGTTYGEFDDRLITETARPLGMPRNVASGDSSDYNFASGRLDHQTYDRSISIERRDIEDIIANPMFAEWLVEALTTPGYMPKRAVSFLIGSQHEWMWRKRPHVDPAKEANAQQTRLANGTTTLARELADDAIDFEDNMRQLVREVTAYRDAGLKHPLDAEVDAPSADNDAEDPDPIARRNGRVLRR